MQQNNYNVLMKNFITHKKSFGATDKILLQNLFNYIKIKKPSTVLDFGCGNGDIARQVKKINGIKKVIAADISDTFIKYATDIKYEKSNKGIEFIHTQTKNIQDNIADVAYSIYVLMEPKEEENILEILRNIYTKLKNGGTYFALNSNIGEFHGKESYSYKIDTIDNLEENMYTTTRLRKDHGNLNSSWFDIHDYYRSFSKYTELFKKAGFKDITIEKIIIPENAYKGIIDEDKIAPAYVILGNKSG